MEPYSLMFLLMLVYCSFIFIDPVLSRRDSLFKNPFWSSSRKDSVPLHQSEFQMVREWNRYPVPTPPRSRWNSRKVLQPRHPPLKINPTREPYPMADIVSELFPGLSFTQQPQIPKENKQPVNEIHLEIDDVRDLNNILGYDDIVLSIKGHENEVVIPRPDTGKERDSDRPSKPFWGPPIVSLTTRPPRPFDRSKENFPFHLPSTVSNVWETTTPGSRNPSENMHNELQNNRPITAPAESFSWRPDDFAPPLVEPTNNEPFDVNFWNSAATESTLSNSQATSESPISRPSESHQHQHVVHDTTSPPVIQLKEIESEHQVPGIAHPHTRQEYHNGYHPPAPTYHPPPALMKVDFSPLFLALIPLALVLGAAASFALSSAVTSNTAVATAQQQQQQQEASNSNNNANSNSNTNTILALLSALNSNQASYDQPYYVIVNGTGRSTGRAIRRKWEQKLLDLM